MKNSRLYSIFFNKCPHCHKADFFTDKNPYHLKTFSQMNRKCPECGEDFHRETGFYYGAMYASYGLTVLIGILMFVFIVLLLKLSVWHFLISYSVSIILLLPVLYRLSRLIWINLFVHPARQDAQKV